MRTTKTAKPSRTVRTKKTARQTSPRKATEATPVAQAARSLRARDPWWMAFAAVCVVGIVVLIGIPSSSQRANRVTARVETDVAEPQEDAALVPLDTFKPTKAAVTNGVARTPKASASTSSRASEPSARPSVEPAASANTATQSTTLATIQGCLQAGNEGFWLKDTAGADAPTSRSWKSGFLKKRSASIEVVDAADSLGLANYLGQRVAATGSLANRRLQIRSLHRVTGSCN